jgi:membrane-associated protease RseP (regulator of RpoE activity)
VDTAKLIEVGCLIAIVILSLGIHEYGHALAAYLCGDDTAKRDGRMTINPVAHIDPFLTIALPAILYLTTGFIFGGARPVPVDPRRLRHPLRDMMLVAIAGPFMNLLLAVLFMVLGFHVHGSGCGTRNHEPMNPEQHQEPGTMRHEPRQAGAASTSALSRTRSARSVDCSNPVTIDSGMKPRPCSSPVLRTWTRDPSPDR